MHGVQRWVLGEGPHMLTAIRGPGMGTARARERVTAAYVVVRTVLTSCESRRHPAAW